MTPSARNRARPIIPVMLGCLVLVTGCSVLEVIDGIGKDTKPAPTAKQQPTPGEPSLPPVPDGSAKAKLRAYYNRKPAEPAEEDPDNPIVGCELRSGTQYMRRHDCTLRGGRALG
jgi:hypothetical protein